MDSPENHMTQEGALGGLTPPVKPHQVRCKLGETIEQPYSDVLTHTPEVCKSARLYNEYPAI
jgi:hypothetical protein